MTRNYQVNSETLVLVKSSSSGLTSLTQLGLTVGPITITPITFHYDVNVDDYGPNVPVDTLFNLAECRIKMTLIHYDRAVLEACMAQSMGGASADGTMVTAGTPMGGFNQQFASGNYYISLNLKPGSSVFGQPWNFPFSYLSETPVEIPLGTQASMVACNWRAIPYTAPIQQGTGGSTTYKELLSAGSICWKHTLDT